MIPVVGEAADLINVGISAARGDYVGAALSLAAMVPFAGWAATGAKAARKTAKLATGVAEKAGKEAAEKAEKEAAEALAEKAEKEAAEKAEKEAAEEGEEEIAEAGGSGKDRGKGEDEMW